MNLIVAVDKKYAISKDDKLLAYLPTDLGYFKSKTIGKIVVMGRKTIDTLPGTKLLKDRKTIILTRNINYKKDGAIIINSISEFFKYIDDNNIDKKDIYISGGANIYNQFINFCNTAYITKIDYDFDGDEHIKNFDELDNWKQVKESECINENGYAFKMLVYKKINYN